MDSHIASSVTYELRDRTGGLIALHQRINPPDGPKRFIFSQPDGTLGLAGMATKDLPLFAIERLTDSAGVIVVEGEKAAEELLAIGVPAVGTVTGASGTPSLQVLAELTGLRVYLWPDNDDVGREHMARIGAALAGIAADVRLVDWPDAREHGDAADPIGAGASKADVLELIETAQPLPAAFHSAQTPRASREGRNLPFRTARQVGNEVPAMVRWYLEGYIAAGAVTELVGKIKAAGKTTFVTHAIASIVAGARFLDRATTQTSVLYLTEQSATSFRVALARARLLERDDLTCLFWRDTAGLAWPVVVAAAVAECARRGAGLLVVDTLPRFAGLRGDAENNAGDADGAMAPLQRAAADGLAVVVVRHERKAGGEVGDSGRGSSAFGGAVDIVLALKRGEGATRAGVRVLHALSRFDETPAELVIEFGAEGYVALGDMAAVAQSDARKRLLADLPGSEAAALSMAEIEERFHDLSASTIERVRDELLASGDIGRRGKGRKGDPFRYWRNLPDEAGEIRSSPQGDAFGQNEIQLDDEYPRSDSDTTSDLDQQAKDWFATPVPAIRDDGSA